MFCPAFHLVHNNNNNTNNNKRNCYYGIIYDEKVNFYIICNINCVENLI